MTTDELPLAVTSTDVDGVPSGLALVDAMTGAASTPTNGRL